MESSKITGVIRGSTQRNSPEDELVTPVMNTRGDTVTCNVMPLLCEITRLGSSWQAISAATAPVNAIPTTACLLTLWNGEQDNGKSYIIDSVFCLTMAGAASAPQTATILVNLSSVQNIVTLAGTIAPRSIGESALNYKGMARVATGSVPTTDGILGNWFPAGQSSYMANTTNNTFGSMTVADCRGMFIIPPKCQISISALSTLQTASSIQVGIIWHEIILPPIV